MVRFMGGLNENRNSKPKDEFLDLDVYYVVYK